MNAVVARRPRGPRSGGGARTVDMDGLKHALFTTTTTTTADTQKRPSNERAEIRIDVSRSKQHDAAQRRAIED